MLSHGLISSFSSFKKSLGKRLGRDLRSIFSIAVAVCDVHKFESGRRRQTKLNVREFLPCHVSVSIHHLSVFLSTNRPTATPMELVGVMLVGL